MNGRESLEKLLEGNRRYASGRPEGAGRDAARRSETACGQKPYAVILGCSDSRIPPEIIFDSGIGDLFVIRVAGDVADDLVLASAEYAAVHLGTPLILVLGHTNCGAVTAAVTGAAEEGHLGAVFCELCKAVEAAQSGCGADSDESDRILEAVRQNALLTAGKLRSSGPVLNKKVDEGDLLVVAALYDIESGIVTLLE